MAILTLNPTVAASGEGDPSFGATKFRQSIRRRHISGVGADATQIQAAVVGERHVITGGRITVEGGGTIGINSGPTLRDQIEFLTAGTATWPVGFETGTGEALAIINPDGLTCVGWIEWTTIEIGGQYDSTGL